MSHLLSNNKIISANSKQYRICEFLGSGSQGEVYRSISGGKEYALKWYYPEFSTENQKNILTQLIKLGAPDERFLWPLELIEDSEIRGFGYIMTLRPRHFKSIVDVMKRKIDPSFCSIITACIELSDSFLKLHQKNLCYRDISFGNVFFEPNTGKILICDNDNVVKNGESTSILGTPRFMAPEIVMGKSKPNIQTDLFSLSVLLFYMLMMHHPLEGIKETKIKCFDLPAMNQLYGKDALFIYDPFNQSNRPSAEYHKNALIFWPIYTEKIRQNFIQAFTRGIHSSTLRVKETLWRDALIEARNSILYCSCGAENFYDKTKILNEDHMGSCWNCKSNIPNPARIRIGEEIIMLNSNTKLYLHHTEIEHRYNFRTISAEIQKHPNFQDVFGLKNLSSKIWTVILPSGKQTQVYPNMNVTVQNGLKINFGNKQGEVRI